MQINIDQKLVNGYTSPSKQESDEEKQYYNEANEALKQWDFNGDGKTSALEMYQDTSKLYSNIFAGNEAFSKRAEELAQQQYEIYNKYAGEDGVLDGREYVQALNSEENSALLEEYWEMKDFMEAAQGEEDIKGLNRHDANNDGNVSVNEYLKDKIDLFNEIFKNESPELRNKALKIVLEQAIIILKYAGSDGILSQDEYQTALRSESFGKSMEQYSQIKVQLKSFMA